MIVAGEGRIGWQAAWLHWFGHDVREKRVCIIEQEKRVGLVWVERCVAYVPARCRAGCLLFFVAVAVGRRRWPSA